MFFKQKTAYEMRISDWSSDVCSSDLDSRGTDSDNWRVSEARAKAVAYYLVTKGIAADRMTVLGVGETRPIAPNAHLDGSDDEQGRAKNRRVDVEVAPAPAPEQEKTEP